MVLIALGCTLECYFLHFAGTQRYIRARFGKKTFKFASNISFQCRITTYIVSIIPIAEHQNSGIQFLEQLQKNLTRLQYNRCVYYNFCLTCPMQVFKAFHKLSHKEDKGFIHNITTQISPSFLIGNRDLYFNGFQLGLHSYHMIRTRFASVSGSTRARFIHNHFPQGLSCGV